MMMMAESEMRISSNLISNSNLKEEWKKKSDFLLCRST